MAHAFRCLGAAIISRGARRVPRLILLLRGVLGVAAADPVFEQTDVFASGSDGYFAFRIPAIESAPDGSLLAFAEARKHHLNDPGFDGQDVDLVVKRSADGGRTWSPMKVIEDPGERWSAANPCTLLDRKTNLLWLFYIRGKPDRNTYTARPGTDDIRFLARTSSDNGEIWSEPVDLTGVARDLGDPEWGSSVPGPGGGICARDGRLGVPVWKFKPWGVFAMVSADHGRTWKRGSLVPEVTGDECQIVELRGGGWLIDIRQHEGPHRWRSISDDGGMKWSTPRPGEFVGEVACAIERLVGDPGGTTPDLLLWTGPKGPGRSNLLARLSRDDGRTFPLERLIAGGRAAYSDLTVLKDGTVGLLWERGAGKDYEFISFTRFDRASLGEKTGTAGARPVQ